MPRQNITHLCISQLPQRYRRCLRKEAQQANFETKEAAKNEDILRRKRLKAQRAHCDLPGLARRRPVALYREFGRCIKKGALPKSAASSQRMRKTRLHLVAWLRYLYLTEPMGSWNGKRNPIFVNIMPRSKSWVIDGDRLCDVDASKLLAQLRIDLIRNCGVPQDGWGFFGLHGEYCKEKDQWHIHVHGLVAGALFDRCQALKDQKKYVQLRDGRSPASTEGATPVQFRYQEPKSLWKQTAYRLQPFWPLAGKARRNRIPEPRHSQWLVWMDRYQPSDLCLLIGLRVEKGRLIRTGNLYTNGKARFLKKTANLGIRYLE